MPATALKISFNGTEVRVFFMTVPKESGGVQVDMYMADEEFMPTGTASIGYSELSEEEYHRTLRAEAKQRGQLVTDYCTDPEWNPES
jgi:hypothetical protein